MKSTALTAQQETLNQIEKVTQSSFDLFITSRLNEINVLEEALSQIVANL